MSKNIEPRSDRPTAFALWFYLFLAAFVVILMYYGMATVASAHALCGMIFVRQMSHISKTHFRGIEQDKAIEDLQARVDQIDPYKDK